MRTAATTELPIGERLRLDLAPEDLSVWPLQRPRHGGDDSSDSTVVHAG